MRNKTKRLRVLLGLVLGALTMAAPVVMPFHANVAFALESAEYPDVPQNHWAYVAINKLSQVGLIEATPNGGTCMGCKSLTRYEFAVAVARILDKIGAEPIGAQSVIGKDYMPGLPKTISDVSGFVKRPEIIDAISALRIEFRPELKALGVRVDGLDKRVLGFSDKPPILTITPRMQTSGRAANYVNEYPDVPQNHWAYIAISKLSHAGFFGGMPNGTYMGDKPMTRYDFAVAIARILDKVDGGGYTVPAVPQNATGDRSAVSPSGTDVTIPNDWSKHPEYIEAINDLRIEFTPELKALGVRVDNIGVGVHEGLSTPPQLPITPRMMISGSAADCISAGNDGKAAPKNQ